MSLFGTSPTEDAPIQSHSRSTLFDAPGDNSSSLFDDGNEWGLPAPKAAKARGGSNAEIIQNLLKNANIPDEYIDLFDDLKRDAGTINVGLLKRLMTSTSLQNADQSKILSILTKTGADSTSVNRDEFNVFLALLGLKGEGEDVSLDAVDERRRNLPIPNLSISDLSSSASSHEPTPAPPPESAKTPISTPSPAQIQPEVKRRPVPASPTIQKTLDMSNNETSADHNPDDPWGSPTMHSNHNHAPLRPPNGHSFTNQVPEVPEPQPQSQTSSMLSQRPSYSSMPSHLSDNDDLQASLRIPRQPGMNAWGGPPSSGGFVDAAVEGGSASASTRGMGRYNSSLGGRGGSTVEERVTVTSLQEKEGVFMFRHRNYQITSERRGSRVVRRYSDFVWLLDCLLKRYPFRQLPILPPKRLAVNGHYLSADNAFIERRRRGLTRFVNALVRHPILKDETLVVMFLTVPTELSGWRKQATISVQEEFVDKNLPPGLEDSLPPNLNEMFDTARAGIKRSCETYIQMCILLERFGKRAEGVAADYRRISSTLTSLTEMSETTYATDTTEVALLNDGLNSVAKHYNEAEAIMEDEIRALDTGVLEDFKRQRDTLVAMRDLFERRDKYATDNIPALEKSIRSNEDKLRAARAKPVEQVKAGEIEKLESSITSDKANIVRQHNRGVLIKECIRDELLFFQNSQYHISRLQQDWAQDRIKYSELMADNWKALGNAVEGMPLGE